MELNSLETATRLLTQAPEILRRWEGRVRAEIPGSRAQKPLVLRNNLSSFVTEVARALSPTGVSPTTIAGLTLSEDHGSHRASLAEYRMGEVFLEYRLLRTAILEVLEEQKPLVPDELAIINGALERAIEGAASQFALVHHETERAAGDEARRVGAELRAVAERERRIAQMLQRPLLVQVAEDAVDGLSLATFYEPARAEAEVGGDFFDVAPLVGGRVALVVGDTCGKGLEAAVHNTHVKDVLRAFLRETNWRSGAILSRLNNVVCDTLEDAGLDEAFRFVVLALLIVEPNTGHALYSSAGAEPLLVVRANGEPEVLERPGLPLGVTRGTLYDETHLHLEPGDTAVLLTDGITEARNGRALLGYPAMVELVRKALPTRSLQAAGREVLDGARNFAHGGLTDDACLILARRR
jgi:serine phosphatase RsbU (regulator of sigma subunit)